MVRVRTLEPIRTTDGAIRSGTIIALPDDVIIECIGRKAFASPPEHKMMIGEKVEMKRRGRPPKTESTKTIGE